jgi:hypothetical protein
MATGCVNTPTSAVYFDETFANNSKGWTFNAAEGWAIGPLVSMPYVPTQGSPDPTVDHTANTNDNGVAGVYIGTQTPITLHAPYYFTSPTINLSSAQTAFLEFWRHLNSDYPPYMESSVEVSSNNGATWVAIYTVPASVGQFDSAWTKVSYDVTAYKSAQFRVRFSWSVGQSGAFDISSWNIDDLRLVANSNCP